MKLKDTSIEDDKELSEIEELYEANKYVDAEKRLSNIVEKRLNTNSKVIYHLIKSKLLQKTGRFTEAIEGYKRVEELASKLENNEIILDIFILTAETNYRLGNLEDCYNSILNAEKALENVTSLKSDDFKEKKRAILNIKGAIHSNRGELNLAILDYQNALKLATDMNNSRGIAIALNNIGTIYQNKGEYDLALENYQKSLKIKEENSMVQSSAITLANIGELHHMIGNYKQAKEKYLQSFELSKEVNFTPYATGMLYMLVIATTASSIEEATGYFCQLKEYKEKISSEVINQQVKLAEAYLLKHSMRSVKKAKAQEIFEEVSKEKIVNHELTVFAKLNLCELLLQEFKATTSNEILLELKKEVDSLNIIAKKQNSHSLLAEVYFIESNLALLELDIEKARNLLTQAQLLAEEKNLDKLAIRISEQHDNFLNQIEKWDSLIKKNASYAERIDLTNLEDTIIRLIRKESYEVPEKLEETPVILMIQTETGLKLYSKKFKEGTTLNDQLISGFLSAFNAFSSEAFSTVGTLERIKHNEFTLIMKPKADLLFCYVFKNHSYAASRKLEKFINDLINNKDLWDSITYNELPNITKEQVEVINKCISKVFQS